MTKSKEVDEVLDLDASSFDEMGRVLDCGNKTEETVDDAVPEIGNPHKSRRCDSAQREVLGNHFPVVE